MDKAEIKKNMKVLKLTFWTNVKYLSLMKEIPYEKLDELLGLKEGSLRNRFLANSSASALTLENAYHLAKFFGKSIEDMLEHDYTIEYQISCREKELEVLRAKLLREKEGDK